jgi:hypothetical protein
VQEGIVVWVLFVLMSVSGWVMMMTSWTGYVSDVRSWEHQIEQLLRAVIHVWRGWKVV